MKKLAITLLISSLITSCSKVQEIDNRTESMNETTKKMSKNTEEMKESTSTLLKLQRQYSCADLRSTQIASLYNNMSDMGDKLVAAKKLMLSFEYQLWNPSNSFDTVEYRDQLLTDALREFFYKASGIHSELMKTNLWGSSQFKRMSPLKLEKKVKNENKYNDEMIFYALATNIHSNNIYQEETISKINDQNILEISIYDVIKSALIKDFENTNLTTAEEIVVTGTFKQVAIDLLKARFNFLIALAIKNLATDEDMSFGRKAKALLFQLTNGVLGEIKLDSLFESSNTSSKIDINQKLEAAIKTREILKAIGHEVEMDKSLKSILKNINIQETVEVTKEINQFLTYIDILNSEY